MATTYGDRVARDGRVIHYYGNGVISYGRPGQCEYNGCQRHVFSGWLCSWHSVR